MANIRVDSPIPVFDGQPLTFRSPTDCSNVTGLIVYYPNGDSTASKVFQFADAHGNNIGDLDLFASDVVVKVILDTDSNLAFVQNADTNAYLESRFRNFNLGDNCYFLDPINQRGQTEYVGTAWMYTIDRWKTSNANTSVTVGNGLTITATESTATPYLLQVLRDQSSLLGKRLTLSVMLGDGTVKSASAKLPTSNPGGVMTYATIAGVGQILYMSGYWWIRLTAAVGGTATILAVKLEVGSTQTLAHQDATGNWVLNDPPPDKGMEQLKCCMSTADHTDTYANNRLTALAVGAAKIATGTYVGTGTYGEANPNTLTFDFVPKLIIISSDVRTINTNTGVWYGAMIVPQWPNYMLIGKNATSGSWSKGNVSVSGNTVSWWAGNGPDQLNYNESSYGAFTYTYTAFG